VEDVGEDFTDAVEDHLPLAKAILMAQVIAAK